MEQTPSPNQSSLDRQTVSSITRLVRRGLMPAKDLPALKIAMMRHAKVGDIARLPRNQREVLQRYNAALSSAALGTTQSMMAVQRNVQREDYEIVRDEYISEEVAGDPPMMMVLKRKGIRIFPDGKRVALYVNEKLGLTFTVPYSTSKGAENPMVGVTEEAEDLLETFDQLQSYATQENPKATSKHFKFADGSKMPVAHGVAKAMHMVHGALNAENKKKYETMLAEPKGFKKAADFALSRVQFTIGGK